MCHGLGCMGYGTGQDMCHGFGCMGYGTGQDMCHGLVVCSLVQARICAMVLVV